MDKAPTQHRAGCPHPSERYEASVLRQQPGKTRRSLGRERKLEGGKKCGLGGMGCVGPWQWSCMLHALDGPNAKAGPALCHIFGGGGTFLQSIRSVYSDGPGSEP